jgi:hypothetical protein
MSQERKAALAPAIKEICKKYGVKASASVAHHSTFVLTVSESKIDFLGNKKATLDKHHPTGHPVGDYLNINVFWFKKHFTGVALEFLTEVHDVMMTGNHNYSDVQSDYFNIGWYTEINIGKWNKPYTLKQ